MKILGIAALATLVAMTARAENVTYPVCIEALDANLKTRDAFFTSFSAQLRTLYAGPRGDEGKAANEAALKARDDVDAAMKAYNDALADYCQAIR